MQVLWTVWHLLGQVLTTATGQSSCHVAPGGNSCGAHRRGVVGHVRSRSLRGSTPTMICCAPWRRPACTPHILPGSFHATRGLFARATPGTPFGGDVWQHTWQDIWNTISNGHVRDPHGSRVEIGTHPRAKLLGTCVAVCAVREGTHARSPMHSGARSVLRAGRQRLPLAYDATSTDARPTAHRRCLVRCWVFMVRHSQGAVRP